MLPDLNVHFTPSGVKGNALTHSLKNLFKLSEMAHYFNIDCFEKLYLVFVPWGRGKQGRRISSVGISFPNPPGEMGDLYTLIFQKQCSKRPYLNCQISSFFVKQEIFLKENFCKEFQRFFIYNESCLKLDPDFPGPSVNALENHPKQLLFQQNF